MAWNTGSAFSWRSFLKALAAIAVPVALQNLLTTTASMVDTMMVAFLGRPSVGAIGLCAQFSGLALFAPSLVMNLYTDKVNIRWTGVHTKAYLIKCFPIICNELLIGVGNMVIKSRWGARAKILLQRLRYFVF